MIQSISILREVYRIWNQPATSRLDSQSVVDALNRCYSQRKLDFGMSGGAYLAKISRTFTVDDDSRSIDLKDIGIAENLAQFRIEAAGNDTGRDTDWREIKVGDFSDWSTYRESPEFYAAIYGTGDSLKLVLNHAPGNNTYRLIYEPGDALDGSDLDLPILFQPLMVYDTAIEAGILIDDDSQEFGRKLDRNLRFLAIRQQDALERFKKWLATRNSEGVTTREGFNHHHGQFNARGLPANLYLNGGAAYLVGDDLVLIEAEN